MAWEQIGTAHYNSNQEFAYNQYDLTKYNYRARYAQSNEDITILVKPRGTYKIIPIGGSVDLNPLVYQTPTTCNIQMITGGSYVVHIERELKNTAPTTPGAFTQPTGTLEIGDSKVVSWGASSDAENNIKQYMLEESRNNGGWSYIATAMTPSFTYTVPGSNVTSVKFRVKAVDALGLESPYRESALLTVTKPMYYWSKYNTQFHDVGGGAQYWKGSLITADIKAAFDAYLNDTRNPDGFWYVRGSRVSQSIAPPNAFTVPATGSTLLPKQALTLAFGATTAPALSTYEVQSRYNGGAWVDVGTHTNALTRAFTVTTDKLLTAVEYRVRAKNTSNVYSDYVYSEAFIIEHNKIPTVTLNTENNVTLYENDTFKIDGSGLDIDIGDIVNVYYRINGGLSRAIAVGISKGASIPFNEQLSFKSGVLYEGETAVTDALAEGPAHRLEVWSEDNQGGKSPIAERTFYVVPNRAPALTVDAFTDKTGMINNDTIKLSGISSDPDGNDVTVKYRVNEQAAVQIHSGVAGPWSFDISLKSLKDGENIIVVEVTDTYNFKSSRTIKLNKTANLTPLEHSVQRYKIVPPSGSAQGVLLWIQRDDDQEVTAEISMTIGTEQEQFVPLPLDSTVPMGEEVEDYFKYRADTPAEHIALKLSWTGDKPITFISGVLLQ